ncbi:hypothetical protein GOODEAATRI_001676, partial [Goodea atripinnis]
QSVGSTWQTVADHVKHERHTVVGLFPNTVYLFIVRAVNSYGLSDPSPISEPVRTQDGSPTEQGVDHRQVQRELGEVSIYLQKPVVLSPTSARISWTVARQSRYIQGYRIFYRMIPGSWLVRDAVSVVQLTNSSSVSVSWEPPPHNIQTSIILEYKVWCLPSDGKSQINRTVDGSVVSILLTGLLPGIQYTMSVAAVTSLGVGALSLPVSLLLSESLKLLQPRRSVKYGRMHSQRAEFTEGKIYPQSVMNGLKTRCCVIITPLWSVNM